MSIHELKADLTVDQLLQAVSQLSPEEITLFEQRWDELRLQQAISPKKQIARVVDRFRLPRADQARVKQLLKKNAKGELSKKEEQELDAYMAEIDRRNLAAAEALMQLARRSQQRKRGRRRA